MTIEILYQADTLLIVEAKLNKLVEVLSLRESSNIFLKLSQTLITNVQQNMMMSLLKDLSGVIKEIRYQDFLQWSASDPY